MPETNDQAPEQPAEPTPEDSRRQVLRQVGKYALYTAPVLLAALTTTEKANAHS